MSFKARPGDEDQRIADPHADRQVTAGPEMRQDDSVFGRSLTAEERAICRGTHIAAIDFSVRASTIARVLGFVTALDIAIADYRQLKGARNCGTKTIAEFRSALVQITVNGPKPHVEPADSFGTSDDGPVFGGSLTDEERTRCGATSVDLLGLSVRASHVAKAFALVTALDVAMAKRKQLLHLKECRRTTIREFRSAIVGTIQESSPTPAADVCRQSDLEEQIAGSLSMLEPRSQLVLRKRFGMWSGEKTTLEGVATHLGLTGERIRQIETTALKRLRGSRSRKTALQILVQVRDSYLDPTRSPALAGVLTPVDVKRLYELRLPPDASGSITRGVALRFLVRAFDERLEHFKDGVVTDSQGRWFRSAIAAQGFQRLESKVRTVLASKGRPAPIENLIIQLSTDGIETTALELRRLSQVSKEIVMSPGQLALPQWKVPSSSWQTSFSSCSRQQLANCPDVGSQTN